MAFIPDTDARLAALAVPATDCARDRTTGMRAIGSTVYGPLKFHVPEPAVHPRLLERADPEGRLGWTPSQADSETIRDLAYSIIRFGRLRDMMTLRAFDSRMLMAQGKAKHHSTCSTWARRR
jgi:hypothetical protein